MRNGEHGETALQITSWKSSSPTESSLWPRVQKPNGWKRKGLESIWTELGLAEKSFNGPLSYAFLGLDRSRSGFECLFSEILIEQTSLFTILYSPSFHSEPRFGWWWPRVDKEIRTSAAEKSCRLFPPSLLSCSPFWRVGALKTLDLKPKYDREQVC